MQRKWKEQITVCIYPTLSQQTSRNIKSIFKRSKAGVHLFFLSPTVVAWLRLNYTDHHTISYNSGDEQWVQDVLPRNQREPQTAWSRIWTQKSDSIFYHDKQSVKHTSITNQLLTRRKSILHQQITGAQCTCLEYIHTHIHTHTYIYIYNRWL